MTAVPPEDEAVQVLDHPGSLPRFWDRNAVFVANLLGLFFGNELASRALAAEVGEVDSYGGRLVPILDLLFQGDGRNLLILEREPDPALCRYFAETVGLSLPERAILPHRDYLEMNAALGTDSGAETHPAVERIRAHGARWIDGYVTDETLERIARFAGKETVTTGTGSRAGNNKRLLHEHLQANGFPVVPTELAAGPGDLPGCLARLAKAGFSAAVVKAPVGASGIGLRKVEDLNCPGGVELVPEFFFFEGPCLVQGWLRPGEFGISGLRSPSVQLFLDEETVHLYDITEQILSQASIHEGNESPPPYLPERGDLRTELLRQAGEAGRWLHGQGYRGAASADFLVTEHGEEPATVYVCEINARVTGATYPSVLARHFLPEGSWLLRNLRFTDPVSGDEILTRLRDSGDLFVPGGSGTGVFPVNFNFGEDGLVHKGQFLCLAHSTAGHHMLLELAELDLPCEPDRD